MFKGKSEEKVYTVNLTKQCKLRHATSKGKLWRSA